jgi:KH/beta-lactamase-domain protein
MADIIKEILKILPSEKISAAVFEGANIVLYTKNKTFFFDNQGVIKKAVDEFKKRIELRPDPSITMDEEEAEKEIRKVIGKEAGVSDVIFDTQRSRVMIHAEKPGLAIGKQGSLLRQIKEKTLWIPIIRRTPAIRSKLIESIRAVLYQNSEYRRKFLDKIGHRIYDGWIRQKKHEWIRITFLGAGRQVGRSCLLLQTPESRVLMDCGIDMASDSEAFPYLDAPELKIDELDAVIITHSHLDHSGLLPYLFKFGYKGPVYCTAPTRDVMALLQLDYVKIQRNEGKEPLYTSEEVKEMVKHTICLDWGEVSDITPDVRLTLYNSGHILGSSMAHLHVGNGLHNILYSGDVKYGKTNLLDPADTKFPRLETMIIEATYGGKDNVMPPRKEADELVKALIKRTFGRNGKILIPVLGSGRAQQIMILIEELVKNKEIDEVPVYIDGMCWDITAIHTAYPEFLNSKIKKSIFHKEDNPFLNPIFRRVGSQKERKQVIEEKGSCIILATSGMLVGGPSVEYFRALAEDKRNTLLFSCYQGAGSLGKRVRDGEREAIFRFGTKQEMIKVNFEVETLEITDHSDRKELMNYVRNVDPKPRKVIVQHGENSRCLDLASSVHKANRIETNAPRNLESIRVR